MHYIRFVFMLLLFLSTPVLAAPYRLAVFGDSLAAGYRLPQEHAFYTRLEDTLQNALYDVTVINASRSGRTTADGLAAQNALIRQKPDAVILELGINDTFKNSEIKDIFRNIDQLITRFKAHNIPVLLVGMKTLPDKDPVYRAQFEQMYRDLADKHDIFLYPFFMEGVFGTDEDGNMTFDNLLEDRLHPNANGVQIMVDHILSSVITFINHNRFSTDSN